MRSSRPGAVLPSAITAFLCLAGCGSSSGEDANVEFQVVYGLVGDSVAHHFQVRVTTPRDSRSGPLNNVGIPTDPANWTKFMVLLNEGELVEVALLNQNGSVASSGKCGVHGAVALEYARAFIASVPFFNGQPIECADGLQ
jgi:hypothetical protein